MNIELEKIFSFPCVLVGAETGPWINSYEVGIKMRALTDQGRDYNIAYKRMKFWFQDIMHSAVLIHDADPKLQTWRDTGLACVDFPREPVDQIVGLMLMSKLTAMVEGRLEISRLSISSPADDYVTYFCDHTDDLHWFEQPGWWRDPGPTHSTNLNRGRKSGKVIAISPMKDWKQYDLDWGSDADTVNTATVTIFSKNDPE